MVWFGMALWFGSALCCMFGCGLVGYASACLVLNGLVRIWFSLVWSYLGGFGQALVGQGLAGFCSFVSGVV